MRILFLILLNIGICNIALAQTDWERRQEEARRRREELAEVWKPRARKIIYEAKQINRNIKSIWQSDEPVGASAKYMLAWKYMIRKAKEVHFSCEDLIQRAEMIEQSDAIEQSVEELIKLIDKHNLLWNEFRKAEADLADIPYADPKPKAEPSEKPKLSIQQSRNLKQPVKTRQPAKSTAVIGFTLLQFAETAAWYYICSPLPFVEQLWLVRCLR